MVDVPSKVIVEPGTLLVTVTLGISGYRSLVTVVDRPILSVTVSEMWYKTAAVDCTPCLGIVNEPDVVPYVLDRTGLVCPL